MGVIDDIKERLDIVEIITESGVSLRKTGRSFVGFCPFHPNTRTPAFTVYADTQSFYCFGCQASGTAFDYVMRRQGLEFRDALEQLARRTGIELKPRTPEEQQQDQQRTRLQALNTAAARYFNWLLQNNDHAHHARAYLEQRAVSQQSIEAFQLGYSHNAWGKLLAYLTNRHHYTPEEIEAAGLAVYSEQHGYHDRFRGRLLFPIRSAKGDIVGFGGRALTDDQQPKYLNTPQTPLFDKSQVLYGLDLARDTIRTIDAVVVVEGYLDVITAHQHGFRNVVAPLGTALTDGHVTQLKKLARTVYLALDADAAGQRATLRGLQALEQSPDQEDTAPTVTAQGIVRWQRDLQIKIIQLPAGRDPDDVIKTDPQQWQRLLDAARPVMDFYIDLYTAGLDLHQPDQQSEALTKLVPLVQQLDGPQQRVYIARLEQVIGIRAELIVDLVRASGKSSRPAARQQRVRNEQRRVASGPTTAAERPGAEQRAESQREDYLLALLLRHPPTRLSIETLLLNELAASDAVRALLGATLPHLLTKTENRLLYQAWEAADYPALSPSESQAAAASWSPPDWAAALDTNLQERLAALAAHPIPDHQTYRFAQDAEKCTRALRRTQAYHWQRRLLERLATSDDEEHPQLAQTLSALQSYLASISQPRRSSTWEDFRDKLQDQGGDF